MKELLTEDPQFCIDRIKRHLKDVRVRDSIFTYDVVDEFRLSGYKYVQLGKTFLSRFALGTFFYM